MCAYVPRFWVAGEQLTLDASGKRISSEFWPITDKHGFIDHMRKAARLKLQLGQPLYWEQAEWMALDVLSKLYLRYFLRVHLVELRGFDPAQCYTPQVLRWRRMQLKIGIILNSRGHMVRTFSSYIRTGTTSRLVC